MGGVTVSERPSLERLKALDSLPDLPSQLTEANQLCTHSARADMIAKWLLDKLKKSQEVRTNVEAWQSLSSTVRLLSPERLGLMLASHHLVDTVLATLEETSHPTPLFDPIANLFNFLLEVSAGPNGTSVKALLSLPSSQAARLLGIWLQNAAHEPTSFHGILKADHSSVLQTGLAIWQLRKHSTEENEHFASSCLVPAALLLTAFRPHGPEDKMTQKRSASGTMKDDIVKELETVLARHIFLPARTVFYKAQDSPTSKTQRSSEPLNTTPLIEPLLKPLKSAVLEDFSHQASIPLLLDIALRCIATPTPRQRTKEKPWIEAIFHALLACNQYKDGERVNRMTIVKMLQVISARATLSPETLKKLVWDYSVLSISHDVEEWWKPCSDEHWTIIARVLEINADIFAEPVLAEAVSTWLSKKVRRQITDHAKEASEFADAPSIDAEVSRWRSRWLDEILVPIIKAFARRRDLATFVELWSTQLEEESYDQAWSPWVDLDSHLHSELEDSMTDTQILELFDRLSEDIVQAPGSGSTDEALDSARKLGSSIVILNGMIREYRSESLLSALAVKSESLFDGLLKLFEIPQDTSKASGYTFAKARRIWSLLAKTLELWLPVWLEKQSSRDRAAEKCSEILSHAAVTAALAISENRYKGDASPLVHRNDTQVTPTANAEANDAQCFVGSICHYTMPYQGSLGSKMQESLTEILNNLFGHMLPDQSQVLCLHPNLLPFVLESEDRTFFIIKCLAMAGQETRQAEFALNALQAITATAVQNAQSHVLDDLVLVATTWLDRKPSDLESLVGDMLLQVPATSLTRTKREKILNILSKNEVPIDRPREKGERSRLALMIKLMELPNATSELCTDHTVVWRTTLGEKASQYAFVPHDVPWDRPYDEGRPAGIDEPETMALITELTRLVVKHLLATQDQERSQSTLLRLSADCNEVLKSSCKHQERSALATALTVSSSIIRELEVGAKESLRQQLPHRDTQMAKLVLDTLPELVKTTMSRIANDHSEGLDSKQTTTVCAVLDTLNIVVELVASITGDEVDASINRVVEAVLSSIDNFRISDKTVDPDTTPKFTSALVRCFAISCKHGSFDNSLSLATFALRMFNMQLRPGDAKSVLDASEGLVGRLESASRLRLTEHVFASLESEQRASLLLLQACLSKLEKDDFLGDAGALQYKILPQVLRVAAESDDISKQERAMSCVLTVLKHKAFMNNQHTTDLTVATMPKLLRRGPSDSRSFLDVCGIISALLLNHRARLQGRFHLVNKVYQALISKLFVPYKDLSPGQTQGKPLGPEHAHALSRALMLFCEPLALRRQANATSLTDESRKEQAHVGRFVHNVLHHYCSQVLSGSLADGVGAALRPGLRATIEAIEMNDADGVKYLSAAMSNSERAVLRGIYDDWRRFGKWRGG